MHLVLAFLSSCILFFPVSSVAQTDLAYDRVRVTFERTNVSEQYTTVYDGYGRVMGRFLNTPIEVPIDDRTITASIAPDGSRIMQDVLARGTILRNTPNGTMVRILVNRFDGFQADRSANPFGMVNLLNTPTGDMYIPLTELSRMRVVGLTAGNRARNNPNYARFLNAVTEPSGNFVQLGNDPHDEVFTAPAPQVNPNQFKIYPPTCDCIGRCSITSTFGSRKAPTKGASTDHRAVDIASGTGTKLVAPDKVEVVSNGWSNGYGWRTVMKSLTYTSPQVYYAFNHQVSKPPAIPGRRFEPGEEVGRMGTTGRSTGTHLHFEVYRGSLDKNSRIDPLPVIKMNMQGVTKTSTEIVNYSCNNLRARIRGGPSLPSGSWANPARR